MNIVILGTKADLSWLQLVSNANVCIIGEPEGTPEEIESSRRSFYELVNGHCIDLRVIENHPLDPKVIYTVQQVCNPIDKLVINIDFPDNQKEVMEQYYFELLRK
jgi:hypothetical protein